MAIMLLDNKEDYLKHIADLIDNCDICTLDDILLRVLKNVYPNAFSKRYY